MSFDHHDYYERVVKPKRRAAGKPSRATLGADAIAVTLRLPAEVHARLAEQARTNQRTLNAEILAALDP